MYKSQWNERLNSGRELDKITLTVVSVLFLIVWTSLPLQQNFKDPYLKCENSTLATTNFNLHHWYLSSAHSALLQAVFKAVFCHSQTTQKLIIFLRQWWDFFFYRRVNRLSPEAVHLIEFILILCKLSSEVVQTGWDSSAVSRLDSVHSLQPQRQALSLEAFLGSRSKRGQEAGGKWLIAWGIYLQRANNFWVWQSRANPKPSASNQGNVSNAQ